MRVLLAGATGVIGRRVLRLLLENGHHVTALTRRAARAPALRAVGAEPAVVDVHDTGELTRIVHDARPEVVVHQLTDLSAGDLTANAALRRTGTANLVHAALDAGVRRVVAQSIAWAYEAGAEPAREHTALDLAAEGPRQNTVQGVAALEEAVHQAREWVVLRYGLLYGPGTWFAPDGLRAEDARSRTLVAGRDITSFVHVDDAAAAVVAALSWPTGAVNVCDDAPAAGHEWVPAFCRAVDAPAPAISTQPRRPWARGADNHHARERLRWIPHHPSWRDGFATDRTAADPHHLPHA